MASRGRQAASRRTGVRSGLTARLPVRAHWPARDGRPGRPVGNDAHEPPDPLDPLLLSTAIHRNPPQTHRKPTANPPGPLHPPRPLLPPVRQPVAACWLAGSRPPGRKRRWQPPGAKTRETWALRSKRPHLAATAYGTVDYASRFSFGLERRFRRHEHSSERRATCATCRDGCTSCAADVVATSPETPLLRPIAAGVTGRWRRSP